MSGGSFSYAYCHVEEFASMLEEKIKENEIEDEWGYRHGYSQECISKLNKILHLSKMLAFQMREVEWLYSGDTSEGSFLERLKKGIIDEY